MIFRLFPHVDLSFSKLFYNQESHSFQNNSLLVSIAEHSAEVLLGVILLTLCTSLAELALTVRCKEATTIVTNYIQKSLYYSHKAKAVTYLVLVTAISVLLVFYIVKDVFHRARPVQIEEFGGMASFTGPFVISDQCRSNCSFPSGHASVGFMVCSIAYVTTNHAYKKRYFFAGIFLGCAFGLGRIASGAHFLSDVIYSAWIVNVIAYLCSFILFDSETGK